MRQARLTAILDMVSGSGHVTVAEICSRLHASPATVRRDLTALAQQKLVVRTHGGASAFSSGYELPLQARTTIHADAKAAIARRAVHLISPGDVIGMNGGTTTTAVAWQLARADHLTPSDGSGGFTLVTNALNIAYELTVRPHVRIVLAGGTVRPRSYELIGPTAWRTISEVVLDVAVLGVDGVSPRFGLTTADPDEAEVGRALADSAKRVVVVADGSKLDAAGPSRLLPLDRCDVLVTDVAPGGRLAEALEGAGVRVVVAGELRR